MKIDQASGQADPTSASPIHFTAVFNEPVTGFTDSDVTLSGTAKPTTAVVSGGPTTFDIAVSGMSSSGTVIASIPANAAQDTTGNGNSASTSTDNTVEFIDPNSPPTAADDSYSTNEDTPLTEAAPGVLGNDSDSDSGDTLTAELVSDPSHGTLTLNANGSFSYTPATNYNGPDSFTYKATDGNGGEDTATVNITVTPVNDAPVLDAIGNKEVHEGQQLSFTAQATDPDEDAISYSLVDGDSCATSGESCNVPSGASIDPNTGEFSWTPSEAQGPGTYKLKVKATDDGSPNLSAEEQITITVKPVVDTTAPTVFSVNPSDVQTGVSTTTDITVTFSEKIGREQPEQQYRQAGQAGGEEAHPHTRRDDDYRRLKR